MIPFCRTLDEAQRVLAEMARHGLVRGERGLEVWVMCEIPNNVILAAEFALLFDGFSIGSNDLTQLTLGDHPEFAAFLAKIGIDSISLVPDALPRVARRPPPAL